MHWWVIHACRSVRNLNSRGGCMSCQRKIWRRGLAGIAGVGILVFTAAVSDAQVVSNHVFPVNVTNDSPWFQPTRISGVMGDTVTWTNRSQGTHTITSLQQAVPQATEID